MGLVGASCHRSLSSHPGGFWDGTGSSAAPILRVWVAAGDTGTPSRSPRCRTGRSPPQAERSERHRRTDRWMDRRMDRQQREPQVRAERRGSPQPSSWGRMSPPGLKAISIPSRASSGRAGGATGSPPHPQLPSSPPRAFLWLLTPAENALREALWDAPAAVPQQHGSVPHQEQQEGHLGSLLVEDEELPSSSLPHAPSLC